MCFIYLQKYEGFACLFFFVSIVRTFAQHRDDRRRVEKAFIESTGLASGKVIRLVEVL